MPRWTSRFRAPEPTAPPPINLPRQAAAAVPRQALAAPRPPAPVSPGLPGPVEPREDPASWRAGGRLFPTDVTGARVRPPGRPESPQQEVLRLRTQVADLEKQLALLQAANERGFGDLARRAGVYGQPAPSSASPRQHLGMCAFLRGEGLPCSCWQESRPAEAAGGAS